MDETANLKLPYILAAQSQKHVTHNEALRALDAVVQLAVADKDLSTPPGSPAEGARYIVGASATGSWSGHATHVAAWQDGAWAFYVPVAGWLAWVDDESQSYLYAGGGWIPAPGGAGASLVPKGAWSAATTYTTGDLVEHDGYAFLSNIDDNLDNEPDAGTPGSSSEWTYFAVVTGGGGGGEGGSVNPVSLVGVNATADATNRLSVSSPASLFSHEGAGHQLKINKDASGDTASVLFQTDFSGRAEFGLAGDDDFHVKVSSDGSSWHEAIVINRSTGAVRATGLRDALAANRTYYVRSDGSDSNTGLANTSGGAFATIQKAVDVAYTLDLNGYNVTIQVADGTWTASAVATGPLAGKGALIIQGNPTTPANVVWNVTSGRCLSAVDGAKVSIAGVELRTTTGGECLVADGSGSKITIGAAMRFGACASAHMMGFASGLILGRSSYSIVGGATYHTLAQVQGCVDVQGITMTLTGTPAFSGAFARATTSGLCALGYNTFSGSATGVRYQAVTAGGIDSNAGGASYLPGNSAGTATSPGWYA